MGESKEMRRIIIVAATAAVTSWAGIPNAQPITSFADVAGKWSGVGSSGGKTEVAIDPNGRFVLESPLGKATGWARIEGGFVVLAFDNSQGQIRFTRTGDALEGPYVAGARTRTTRVTRVPWTRALQAAWGRSARPPAGA